MRRRAREVVPCRRRQRGRRLPCEGPPMLQQDLLIDIHHLLQKVLHSTMNVGGPASLSTSNARPPAR